MLCALCYSLGQCLVTASVATYMVLKITNACSVARDIRNMLWWDRQLRTIEEPKKMEV